MSTVDHILSVCGRLRTSWKDLADATVPGRARRNQRVMNPKAGAARDTQARNERADRHAVLTSGRVPTGTTTVPVNLSAVDAREQVIREVDHNTSVMGWRMRELGYRASYNPNRSTTDARFNSGIDWISTNVVRLQDKPGERGLLNDVYRGLSEADTLARQVLGEGPDRRRLASECPACGRRSLYWDTSSPRFEEWHIACGSTTCKCQGVDCACKTAGRQPGMTHVWTEASWERLAAQLNGAA